MRRFFPSYALLAAMLIAACAEVDHVEAPPPEKVSYDSIGYYCNMAVMNHKGPKGQMFLKGREKALWFTAVRDVVAYTMLFDEAKDYAVIYVTDMGKASDWDHPEENGPWVEAQKAYYVLGSAKNGGMGAPETVPFSERTDAEDFAQTHGGDVVRFSEIPQDAVLGGVELGGVTGIPPMEEGGEKP